MPSARFHVFGIDDAPFQRGQEDPVPIVGVLMEGATLVEGVAVGSFPVDGEDAAEHLATWIRDLRWHSALHALVLGGITLAGLGVVDLAALANRADVPVIAVTRRPTEKTRLSRALTTAGHLDRVQILERTPPSRRVLEGLFLTCAAIEPRDAVRIVLATLAKSKMPEPLRIAHLIASAFVRGQSRGRV